MEAKHYATKQSIDHWRNQRRNKKNWDKLKWRHNDQKSIGCSKSSSKKEVYSNTSPPRKKEKSITNKQLNLTPKGIRRRRTRKTKS